VDPAVVLVPGVTEAVSPSLIPIPIMLWWQFAHYFCYEGTICTPKYFMRRGQGIFQDNVSALIIEGLKKIRKNFNQVSWFPSQYSNMEHGTSQAEV
jgi:hypothetical protein